MVTPKDRSKSVPCPQCASPSAVVRTRRLATGSVVRRRECLDAHCRHRFSTAERVQPAATGH